MHLYYKSVIQPSIETTIHQEKISVYKVIISMFIIIIKICTQISL